MDLSEVAMKQTLTCFANSLAREWKGFTRCESPEAVHTATGCKESFRVEIAESEPLWLPLQKYSLLGKHQYGGSFFIGQKSQSKIDFFSAAALILNDLLKGDSEASDKKEIFISRLQNSYKNMEEALVFRNQDLKGIYSGKFTFSEVEQALMVGHNFHPYPKMREGFDDEDYSLYAPEMGGKFQLHWFLARPEILFEKKAKTFLNDSWLKDLFSREVETLEVVQALEEGYIPFPVHPWQKKNLLRSEEIKEYLQAKELLDVGPGRLTWKATSSLRSLYCSDAPFMLKFSMTLRLTNSIRHLTPAEVVRGQQVHDVFQSLPGQEFLKKFPYFKVVSEPAFVALKKRSGQMMTDSIVVCRQNPFETDPVDISVLSTVVQDPPVGQESLLRQMARKHSEISGKSLQESSREWLKSFIKVAVSPLMAAQSHYGILLGAHQQNLLLRFENHLPVEALFRDCQGTGYSQTGYEIFKPFVENIEIDNGNVLDERGNFLFSYYLIINSTFNVIASLACDEKASEEILLSDLREFLVQMRKENPKDDSCLNYLLDKKEILQKGNFYCSLQNINENTTANPLAIYNPIMNPIANLKGV